MNFQQLNGVKMNKKHRREWVLGFRYRKVSQKVSPNSEVMAVKSGKKERMVTTALGSRGLGLLRLEEAFKGSGNLITLWINNSKDNKEGYSNTSGSRGTENLLAKDVNALEDDGTYT
ncbi:hypothetical protein L2E82_00431 [Cichorium intybus]|uniref:Uncharacterized protein n=1 Tax=Cichorium intybus TaxID=13427 RepID=A0ACB9GWT1_CICIN|nr:hypothetical protein L2E82_00431 [Cichorium intybus]